MKKALVIGTGSIAKKHIINLNQLKYTIYVFSWEHILAMQGKDLFL